MYARMDALWRVRLGDLSWFCGNDSSYYVTAQQGAKEVAQKPENSYGLFDMNGNIWEWTHDYYGLYSPSITVDPVVQSGENRLIRGGGWGYYSKYLRSAHREPIDASSREYYIGMRLARSDL